MENIPINVVQKVALSRVLARQEGKVPSSALYDKSIGQYYIPDTEEHKQKAEFQSTLRNVGVYDM